LSNKYFCAIIRVTVPHKRGRRNGMTYDIYIRISDEGARTKEEVAVQLEEYEKACRAWAEREGVEVGVVERETNVSGSTVVAERRLEHLLVRVEGGESNGILTPYLDRFGRDQIEGCLAWRRLARADGRLVCVNDGLDSLQPGAKLNFQIRMAIAEDYLERTRANFIARQQRAAKVDGKHLGGLPAIGYRRVPKGEPNAGSLVVVEEERKLVRELFHRRARGSNFAELLRWLQAEGIPVKSKTTVKRLLTSRTFLGEVSIQTSVKGEPEILKNAHEPLVTEREWEVAQRRERYPYVRNGSIASQTRLAGLVRCATCGRPMAICGTARKNGVRKASYICTSPVEPKCTRRVGITASTLDAYVGELLSACFLKREPHVAAIMEGDHRYQDALEAVEAAKTEVDAYIEAVSVADVGRDSFKRGLDTRKAALAEARRVLAETPPPKSTKSDRKRKPGPPVTLEEAEPALMREHNARFISKVVIKPGRRGARSNPAERAEVWLVGSDTPLDTATVLPELTVEIEPASAKDVRADLKRAAARGDKSAADYLAATAARAS
jgi:site-specific DNA recombinase